MSPVLVPDAAVRLPELLTAASAGVVVEIQAADGQLFRLLPRRPRPTPTGVPRAGTCAGLIEIADDFDASFDDLREYMS